MSADDYYADSAPETPDHDAKIPEENWMPGASLIAIEDDGEVTLFPDTQCDSATQFMSCWVTIDAEHAIPRGAWR